jgi:hypothetical protein
VNGRKGPKIVRRAASCTGVRAALVATLGAGLVTACALDRAGKEIVGADAGPSSGNGAGDDGEFDGGGLDFGDDASVGGNAHGNPDGATGPNGTATGSCDLTGTWGTLITIDVSWMPAGLNLQAFVLAPGTGTIKQWARGVRVQHGTKLEDATVVCGIELPDFRGTSAVAGQQYGVLFPDSLFDGMFLPTFPIDSTVTASAPDGTFKAAPSAALLGLTMADPTTDPWPATVTTATDPERDGTPGVTVDTAQGPVPPPSDAGLYSYIPVGIPAPFQPVVVADKLRLAIRQVTEITGTIADCDHISGTVSIPQIAGQYAIDSHVIGCEVLDGGNCTAAQASFVDNTQPVFSPTGTTTFASVRLPPGTTCATVRTTLQ